MKKKETKTVNSSTKSPKSAPIGIDAVENDLELGVALALLHHGQVVAERAQARLELLVVELARLVLVKVLEHHAELAQRLLAHAALVAVEKVIFVRLDLFVFIDVIS